MSSTNKGFSSNGWLPEGIYNAWVWVKLQYLWGRLIETNSSSSMPLIPLARDSWRLIKEYSSPGIEQPISQWWQMVHIFSAPTLQYLFHVRTSLVWGFATTNYCCSNYLSRKSPFRTVERSTTPTYVPWSKDCICGIACIIPPLESLYWVRWPLDTSTVKVTLTIVTKRQKPKPI